MNIINDALTMVLKDIPLQDSIELSLGKNKESITVDVNNFNEDSIWCNINELTGKINCQWLSGEVCHCQDSSCILDTVRNFTKLFIAMRTYE